jgi:hypothetical protein
MGGTGDTTVSIAQRNQSIREHQRITREQLGFIA